MKKHCSNCCCCCYFKNKILINKSNNSDKNKTTRRQAIIFMTCFMNLGLTWLTGFFLIIPIDNQYIRTGISFLFCLFNSMQGFFLFTIYILISKSRRNNEKLKQMKHFLTSNKSNIKTNIDENATTTTNANSSSSSSSSSNSHVYYNQSLSNETEIYSVDDYSKL